jgi:S-adenosylmethionine:tRNA ribosyltransferase-isomerase
MTMDDDTRADYDYPLPEDLIAQEPLPDRDGSRLLCLCRSTGSIEHRGFRDLPDLLRPGDLLVTNDTQVLSARLVGRRAATGGRWEGLFLSARPAGPGGRRTDPRSAWEVLTKTGGRPRGGERVVLADRAGHDADALELIERRTGGIWLVAPVDGAATPEAAEALLTRLGRVPLPGYIRGGEAAGDDVRRYQTIFARRTGSAAAPTAGLHFTPRVLESLAAKGIARASVTLHVGLGTFRPIQSEKIDDHTMHAEWCECPEATVDAFHRTRAAGGRVVAVGTTCVRSLETAALGGSLAAWRGQTDLFIRPGHRFRAVDAILTNFHMPRTTLLVLVSAFAGRAAILRAYNVAVQHRYRMLSYGDCMLIA